MGDRIAVMKDGVVQQLDTPLGLYHNPVNMFVAGFIGTPSMNFVDASLASANGSVFVDTGAFKVRVPDSKVESVKNAVGKPVVFGVRPEDIFDRNLHSQVTPTEDNSVKATVDVIEPMGAIVTAYLTAGPHSLVATIDADTKAKEAEQIDLVLDMERTHVFDKETEQAYF